MSMWQKLLALSCCIVLNINTMQLEKPSTHNNFQEQQPLNHLLLPQPILYEQDDTRGKQVIIVRYGTDGRAGTPFFVGRTTTIEDVAAHMKRVINQDNQPMLYAIYEAEKKSEKLNVTFKVCDVMELYQTALFQTSS
jgi:hypothetical protein